MRRSWVSAVFETVHAHTKVKARHVRALPVVLVASVTAIAILGAATVSAGTGMLASIEVGEDGIGSLGWLADEPVEIYYWTLEYLLVGADEGTAERIRERGNEVEVLDLVPWSEPYYVISRPQGEPLGVLPAVGLVLYRTEREAVVKVQDGLVEEFGEAGFMFARIFQQPLPWPPRHVERLGRIEQFGPLESDTLIARLVGEISADTIEAYIQRMQDYQTRYTPTDSCWASAQWIQDKFLSYGYVDVELDSFWVNYNPWSSWAVDVVAVKSGTLYPTKYIVIGGHYDSVTYGWEPGPWEFAPGADDNATGAASTMEIARALADEDIGTSVVFIAFSAEEQGLFGSWHYASWAAGMGMDIVLMLNMDMTGRYVSGPRYVDMGVGPTAEVFGELCEAMALEYTDAIPLAGPAGANSDHWPFIANGFDALMLIENDFNYFGWHSNHDSLHYLDMTYCQDVAQTVVATAVALGDGRVGLVSASDHMIDEAVGDGDGRAEPGETINFIVILDNDATWTGATNVSAVLRTDDPTITITDSIATFPDIPIGGSVDNSLDPFVVEIGASDPHMAEFTVEITSTPPSFVSEHTLEVIIGHPAIMVVDDDEGDEYEHRYQAVLGDSFGLFVEIWEVATQGCPEDWLLNAEVVIWYTGDATENTLTPDDITALSNFLDGGGKLFITGENVAEDLDGSNFLSDYLHTALIDPNSPDYYMEGVPGDTIGDGLLVIDDTQTSMDIISPVGADSVLTYSSGGAAAVRYEGAYKVVFFGFGFEWINDQVPTSSHRHEVMARVLNWFGMPVVGVSDGDDDAIQRDAVFWLGQSYPNPLRGSAAIRYVVPGASAAAGETASGQPVTLKVYNVLGQVVRTLVDRTEAPGDHVVTWDRRGDSGRAVAPGIYFYRLEVGDESATRKVVVLR
ncbi:hypothetical protein AMJ39_08115 [candidate division TA06 bacterium DG_24]|uniref:Peptidase M28 domain-containing protein n=3 Tax=Bacteria division TA06 TaxID=1156500 RepID=A0A0S8GC89_UNCT6|nr:MAG: hypothetical protein AMJ39_08115 [candidate division TA06 bacterium DG_24]KPK70478.1 MAG: hypothetical protein AMJ82_03145 [candidate division TA06 bacterium SM23_40]